MPLAAPDADPPIPPGAAAARPGDATARRSPCSSPRGTRRTSCRRSSATSRPRITGRRTERRGSSCSSSTIARPTAHGDAVPGAAEAAGIGAVTRIVRREGDGLPDGKGAALSAAQPDACRGDVVVVLDADARIGPDFLRRLAAYVRAGAGSADGSPPDARRRRRLARRGAGRRADARRRDPARPLVARRLLGVPGQRDRRPARPARVGGWLAPRGADRGPRPVEPARGDARDRGRVGDRRRGLGGARPEPRVACGGSGSAGRRAGCAGSSSTGRRSSRSPALGPYARLDFAAYAGQLVHPAGHPRDAGRRRRPRPVWRPRRSSSGPTSRRAARWPGTRCAGRRGPTGSRSQPAERVRRSVRVGLFNAVWLAAIPAALLRLATRRGRVGYAKMAHVGGGRGEWVG